jgi:putative glutamine amidotransferase
MKKQPLIGIPCRADTSGTYPGRPINAQNDSYIQALIKAGAVPFLIPLAAEGEVLRSLFRLASGILLSGGGDVDPACYDQEPGDLLSDVQPERDQRELLLTQWCVDEGKPMLGICRGIQVMAVAGGGTLWQDLATENPQARRHDYYYTNDGYRRDYLAHSVMVESASLLARVVGPAPFAVNSLHHQAVRELPRHFYPVGRADDGVIEAIEVPDHPFCLGVQWHPEELVSKTPESNELFRAFVQISRNQRG